MARTKRRTLPIPIMSNTNVLNIINNVLMDVIWFESRFFDGINVAN